MSEALIYGTQNGFIVCCLLENTGSSRVRFHEIWNRQMSAPAEVTGLAFDPATNRLAACHRGGVLQMFTLSARMIETEMISLTISDCVPGVVLFGAMHSNERELLVFGLYCGLVYNMRGTSICSADAARSLGSDAAVDLPSGTLCVSDPQAGVHLYRLAGGELVKSFGVPVKKTQRIHQIALFDSNRAIVSGSDHGTVYVYARRDKGLNKLQVDPNEWVQTVTAADVVGVPTIFAAKSSAISGKNEIFVYRKTLITPDFRVRLMRGLKSLVWLVVLLAALAYGFEKVLGDWSFARQSSVKIPYGNYFDYIE
ncbi:unnamed protein product [Mycena citricolor]|uniref:WD40 repeat-like protein n=1 Tax=Mycena citricolor TaxID=2018698 RepID=A0AAD2Q1W1_9AGAR|nr:unnamed protein product [Mycena citricolor]